MARAAAKEKRIAGRAAPTRRELWIGIAWPLAQQSAAAVTAWLIADRIAGHEDPFFAPVAAVVGLNAALGRRGSNAVRLLAGVLIGVLVGEFAVWLAGGNAWTLAAATFLAMLLARAVDAARIVQAQAGISAILVLVLASPQQGWERLADAVIGAGVALMFSQLLFTPEPLRLLRAAEAAVLSNLARGLQLTADALEHDDRGLAEVAVLRLRDLRDDLAALSTTRKASDQITRHALTWRRRAGLVMAERERADRLDLLAGSCLMLSRTAAAVEEPLRARLAGVIRALAAALADLATDPGDQASRQAAADLASWATEHQGEVTARSALAPAYASIQMVATDMIIFTGVNPGQEFRTANASDSDS